MHIEPISVKRTYQYIVDQIIALIIKGDLKAGDKLPPERNLAEMFGVSRASIREAFRALEIVGIIEVKPGGGTYVIDFNIAPFINSITPLFIRDLDAKHELMDFRMMLEGETVKLAARTRAAEGIERMRFSLRQMKGALEQNNQKAGEEYDIAFHHAIFLTTGNRIFITAGECLFCILSTSVHVNRSRLFEDAQNNIRWCQEHQKVLEAVEAGEDQSAYHSLMAHLEGVREKL